MTGSEEEKVRDTTVLGRELQRIDGRGYGAYKDIRGRWSFGPWILEVAWVQGDPYASPSRLHALLPGEWVDLAPPLLESRSRRVGVACHLARAFVAGADRARSRRGSGKSGVIRMESPGQQVLDQTAVTVQEDGSVEARFYVGLPARGRRILGGEAEELLLEAVPDLVAATLRARAHEPEALLESAEVNEDADVLRGVLPEQNLVAFVADGAVLPRRSGVDDRPMEGSGVVPFESPDRLRVTADLPNAGPVTGMGIPRGVTLVVGGGFHGKSTLLRAVEGGVWNHRPGDGRERVVTDPAAVKVRAEDGRSVQGVDISPFIDTLPGAPEGAEVDTRRFTTPDASGSTSQAATIMEAVEAGATTLLVDEDTAATNFMIRDRRMQELVPREGEPITPFVDRVRDLFDHWDVSSVLVLGGSGDYLEVADAVVAMREYRPHDVTVRAREVADAHPTGRQKEVGRPLGPRPTRVPLPDSVDPSKGHRSVRLRIRDDRIVFGTEDIEIAAVEQLLSRAQTHTVARALVLARERFMDGEATLPEILDQITETVDDDGLDALSSWRPGDLTAFRRFEVAAVLNRLRTLRVR